jgi:peptidoglycan/xylan/chitin deacetylase (PgdA/CDA1 family)
VELSSRQTNTSGILVLGYHAVSDRWPSPLAVTQTQLRQQLEWVLSRGYRPTTFYEALTGDRSSPRLVVTFDDAYKSVVEFAYPTLASLGIPGTVFAVTDFASGAAPLAWPGIDHWLATEHRHELQSLTWRQLVTLADDGWEVGSHTRTHPRLTQLDDAALQRELRGSRDVCERKLDRPCRSLAYPYGDFDERVLTAAGAAGYEAAAIEGLAKPAYLAWPRVGVYRKNSMSAFRMKASPTIARFRTAIGTAERARSKLTAAAPQPARSCAP